MENTNVLDSDLGSSGMKITPEIKLYLEEAAKWAKFISIVVFILAGLYGIIALLGMISGMAAAGQLGGGVGVLIFYLVFFIIYAAIMIMVGLYLYRFADSIKMSLVNNNQQLLTKAMLNLKRYFKLIGILIIVLLVFMVLGMIFAGSMMTAIMSGAGGF